MRRGEIRWYKFSSPDKKRPVLLLTRDSVLDYLGEVTIASITTVVWDIPSEALLTPEESICANLPNATDQHEQLIDELSTIALTEFDAETRFRARVALGSREEGLRLLDLLDREH
jgi:hypothetical protein